MTFDQAVHLTETWGLALLTVLFVAALIYAFWPGNRENFKKAAETPLNDEEENGRQD